MNDLNDLYYFAAVVDHGGFAAAERALGIPKSRLSRRISALEGELGVRLLQRSTRRFAVTDVGTSVHRHAQSMLAEAQAAREAVDRLSAEPRGVVRVSVPVGLAQQQIPHPRRTRNPLAFGDLGAAQDLVQNARLSHFTDLKSTRTV